MRMALPAMRGKRSSWGTSLRVRSMNFQDSGQVEVEWGKSDSHMMFSMPMGVSLLDTR